MFSDCSTLAELNAARIQAAGTMDIITVNNAYNARRAEILQARSNFTRITPVFVTIAEPVKYSAVPVAGYSQEPGVIQFTPSGFLI